MVGGAKVISKKIVCVNENGYLIIRELDTTGMTQEEIDDELLGYDLYAASSNFEVIEDEDELEDEEVPEDKEASEESIVQ